MSLRGVEMSGKCEICRRIEMIKSGNNPYFVKELETGYVVIGDNQHFYGYTVFLCKEHKKELFELDKVFRRKYLDEMVTVSQAVTNVFNCEKMNYECLGNGESHIHFHLFPRTSGDLGKYGRNGKGPVWWMPPEDMWNDLNKPSDEQLEDMKLKLKAEIEKLI